MSEKEAIANRIIGILKDAGLTYDEMIPVIELTKKKLKYLKVKDIEVEYKTITK